MGHQPPAFSIIIPYHLSLDSDRRNAMDTLDQDFPDRKDVEVLWVNYRSTLPWPPQPVPLPDTTSYTRQQERALLDLHATTPSHKHKDGGSSFATVMTESARPH